MLNLGAAELLRLVCEGLNGWQIPRQEVVDEAADLLFYLTLLLRRVGSDV